MSYCVYPTGRRYQVVTLEGQLFIRRDGAPVECKVKIVHEEPRQIQISSLVPCEHRERLIVAAVNSIWQYWAAKRVPLVNGPAGAVPSVAVASDGHLYQ